MSVVTIPWATGTGNITLTFNGQGNGTITVTSDANDLYEERSQTVKVKTTDDSVEVDVTIRQAARVPNFITADNYYIITADNKAFNVAEEQ